MLLALATLALADAQLSPPASPSERSFVHSQLQMEQVGDPFQELVSDQSWRQEFLHHRGRLSQSSIVQIPFSIDGKPIMLIVQNMSEENGVVLGARVSDLENGTTQIHHRPAQATREAFFRGWTSDGRALWFDGTTLHIGSEELSLPEPPFLSHRIRVPSNRPDWPKVQGIALNPERDCYAYTGGDPETSEEVPSHHQPNRIYFGRGWDSPPQPLDLPANIWRAEVNAISPSCHLALWVYDGRESRWANALWRDGQFEVLPRFHATSETQPSFYNDVVESKIVHFFNDRLFMLRNDRSGGTMWEAGLDFTDLSLSNGVSTYLMSAPNQPYELMMATHAFGGSPGSLLIKPMNLGTLEYPSDDRAFSLVRVTLRE